MVRLLMGKQNSTKGYENKKISKKNISLIQEISKLRFPDQDLYNLDQKCTSEIENFDSVAQT